MARPRKILPPGSLDIIRAGSSRALSERASAAALNVSPQVWRRIRDENPEVKAAWEAAKAVEEDKLVVKLWDIAMGAPAEYDDEGKLLRAEQKPEIGAIELLLKCRHNYREQVDPQGGGATAAVRS